MKLAFSSWAGRNWVNSLDQNEALKSEAERLGLKDIPEQWIKEEQWKGLKWTEKPTETKRSVPKKFSRSYPSFQVWLERTTRTTAYQRRIINYIRRNPDSSLNEARGHTKKESKKGR